MSNDEIKQLIQLVVDSGIAELEVQHGDDRVRIRRTLESKPEFVMQAPAAPLFETGQASAATPVPATNEHIVKSPIVGTYYDAPKPGDPPFVKVGDAVEP